MKNAEDEIIVKGFYDEVIEPSSIDVELLKEIARNLDEQKLKDQYGETRNFRKNLRGLDLVKEYLFGPTLNINGIVSGYTGPGAKTMVPASAKCKVDVRLVPNMRPYDMLSKIKKHLKSEGFQDVKVSMLHGYPPSKTSSKSKIAQTIIKAAKRLGIHTIVYPINPGSAPWYVFSDPPLSLPCAGPFNPQSLSRMHRPNEFITIKEYLNTTKLAATILFEFAKEN
jgi:acetylornithine deacetylase/succinyl-diaminopimelate desuccinylase-like protein